MNNLFNTILRVAAIPSFTYHEHMIFQFVKNFLTEHAPDHQIVYEHPDGGLVIEIPGNRELPPVALAAHLDKIDHWGVLVPELVNLSPKETKRKLFGSMDDAVGVGIVLWLAKWLQTENTPPVYLLLSCQEERGMYGAAKIAVHFQNSGLRVPEKVFNIDTCPLFGKKSGVAIYGTGYDLDDVIRRFEPILVTEGINDVVMYRRELEGTMTIAVEPAIRNMHTVNESVHKCDIEKVVEILKFLLTS
jgi:putative aminopeptidase FrvX